FNLLSILSLVKRWRHNEINIVKSGGSVSCEEEKGANKRGRRTSRGASVNRETGRGGREEEKRKERGGGRREAGRRRKRKGRKERRGRRETG
ncbi:hypothetical protein NX871_32185, partial [Burkholderia thailandensis]|uniref:hypothetical protein n=1 Tax=Burkholderia thailandensis TaxID=57975 RepID=UPI00217DFF8C